MTDLLQPAQLAALSKLRLPFADNQISRLPKGIRKGEKKSQCRECGGYHEPCAVHLDYVGHAALTDRLLDADPAWTWAPLATTAEGFPRLTPEGGLWIKLTVAGVTRLGYGAADGKTGGDAIKELIGDALRNAAMRFGAALNLWHKGELHPEGWAPEVQAPDVSEAAQMLAPLSGRDIAQPAFPDHPTTIAAVGKDQIGQREQPAIPAAEQPAGAACGPTSCTLPARGVPRETLAEDPVFVGGYTRDSQALVAMFEPQTAATHGVPRETLADDPARLRAEIRRLSGELGPGALLESKLAIGLAANAVATPAQLDDMLRYLEERAEMEEHDRQLQEEADNRPQEVSA